MQLHRDKNSLSHVIKPHYAAEEMSLASPTLAVSFLSAQHFLLSQAVEFFSHCTPALLQRLILKLGIFCRYFLRSLLAVYLVKKGHHFVEPWEQCAWVVDTL